MMKIESLSKIFFIFYIMSDEVATAIARRSNQVAGLHSLFIQFPKG